MLKAIAFIFSLFFFYLILSIPIKDKLIFDYIHGYLGPKVKSTVTSIKDTYKPKIKKKIPYYTKRAKEEVKKQIDPVANEIKAAANHPNKKELILEKIQKLKNLLETNLELEEPKEQSKAEPAPRKPKAQTKSDSFTDYDFRN